MKQWVLGIFLFVFAVTAIKVSAASLPISVWIPYWKDDAGMAEAGKYLKPIWQINPFGYEVQPDGTLVDAVGITDISWQDFWLDARAEKVKMIPTLSWQNGAEIMTILSSSTARAEHISGIVAHVDVYKFDGVDIDYEGKPAESKEYFSAFLKELSVKLKARKKTLSCTIEARTPLTSRFTVIPKDIEYANDYAAIGKYCDEVKIMGYDQQNVDILLNKQKGAKGYYLPIADKDWIEKVIKETVKTIPAKKVMLGVPSFGYEYQVITASSTITASTTQQYVKVRTISYADFSLLASTYNVKPIRNSAGELSLTYSVGNSNFIAVVSDAQAIADKVKLIKKYSLKGVAVFSVNGEGDPAMWKVLK